MKKIYVVFAILFILLIGYVGINKWLDYEDNPLTQAKRMYPFDNNHIYIIVQTDGTGAAVTSTPYIYAIIKPDEGMSAASLSWRRIGQSTVDLGQYLNKKVYIDGEYYIWVYHYLFKDQPLTHTG